jgi:hypothetical protein
MEPVELPIKQLSKGYNILTDLELEIMKGSNEENMNKIHSKFYSCIPHKETPKLNLANVYAKKAVLISKIKKLSWA